MPSMRESGLLIVEARRDTGLFHCVSRDTHASRRPVA